MSGPALIRKTGHDIMEEAAEGQRKMLEQDLELFCTKYGLDLGDPAVELEVQQQADESGIHIRYCLKKNNIPIETWGYTLDLTSLM